MDKLTESYKVIMSFNIFACLNYYPDPLSRLIRLMIPRL